MGDRQGFISGTKDIDGRSNGGWGRYVGLYGIDIDERKRRREIEEGRGLVNTKATREISRACINNLALGNLCEHGD